MVKSILRAQCDLHHIGEALLALLGGGDLRGNKAVGDGQQAGGVLAQSLGVGEQSKALHLHAEAAALVAQQLPVGGLCVGRLTVENVGGVDVALDELDALLPGGGAQLVIQLLTGEGDVVVVAALDAGIVGQIGRASCRERV